MILVTGSTGNIGHALVDILVQRTQSVRAIVPKPVASGDSNRFQPPNTKRKTDFPPEVDVVEGDLTHPEEMENAFRGVDSIFINPRAVGAAAEKLLAIAKANGVRRVVTLSASNVDEDLKLQPSRYNGDLNKEVEQAVMSSGMEWSALRSTFYAANTIGMWSPQIKQGDTIYGPYASWANSPLDEYDVAEAAAQALLTDVILGRRPVISGPESLTQAQMVDSIGKAIGRTLTYTEIPTDQAKQGMLKNGFSEQFTDAFLALMARNIGQPATQSNELEYILGRPPHTFAEWAARHAADFAG